MLADRLPAHVHADARWIDGGIGRFSASVLPRVLGGGREIGGRTRPTRPPGAVEMAVRFASLGARGGILLSPGFVPPLGWERRTIVTVHDLHYLDPAIASRRHRWYFRNVVLAQIRRCRGILTVSEFSAAEIREALGPGGPDVVVVGNGVDPFFLRAGLSRGDDAARRATPRLAFVGGDKTNKNLLVAMRAVETVALRSPVELVVAGAVADEVRASSPSCVSFIGTVDDESLAELYTSSTALLMPSISEGFGLPALESLAAGTPVVFGDRGALPHVVGDLGWPVDPFDVDSVVAAVQTAIDAPIVVTPDRRRALVDAHRWDQVAERVVSAVQATL
jgi:glycosyltransferase involved in cell wall biosynthesis